MPKGPDQEKPKCRWITRSEAFSAFVTNLEGTEGAQHIKPLHWYVACRLVVEGGFKPDEIRPRPPFEAKCKGNRWFLTHLEDQGGREERTVLGGLKTKNIDVVVTKEGVGPVLAVSMKGTLKSFRNLTNRMEEAVGDCTNIHIAYPAMVYGFLQVLRGTRAGMGVHPNDVAIDKNGVVVDSIFRYHDILMRLAGRSDLRDVTTKYEAVSLCLVDPRPDTLGELVENYPPINSPLEFGHFFENLYGQYDQRFIYAAPRLETTTRRVMWDPESPALKSYGKFDYHPRVRHSSSDEEPTDE